MVVPSFPRFSRAALVAVMLAPLVAACSSPPPKTDPYATEEGFCDRLARAECTIKVVQACYGSDESTLEADTEKCIAARIEGCNPDELPYHLESAAACVEARGEALVDAAISQTELKGIDAACGGVFAKDGADGTACAADTDCNLGEGLTCIVKLGAAEGVCGKPQEVGGGQDCTAPTAVCKAGFNCDAMVGFCLEAPGDGEACAAATPCGENLYCTTNAMCAAKLDNGATCKANDECKGTFCIGGNAHEDGVCAATYPLQITDAMCDEYR